jgi:hypothetical protein
MSSIRVVDLSWPPERIREFCEKTDDWILELDAGMTPADLEALYRRQVAVPAPYDGLIGEIAGDPRTPQWVLEDIATRFAGSFQVMSGLATNPEAPEAVLTRLRQHEHPIVREHAELTLRRR